MSLRACDENPRIDSKEAEEKKKSLKLPLHVLSERV